MHCSQEQYYEYYNYYEDCDEKTDSTEDVITKPDHDYVLGVIVIAAFFALSCSNLGMDQELQEDEYEDTKEYEFVASIVSSWCGRVFKNWVSLTIHVKRTHVFLLFSRGKMSVQCSDCVKMFMVNYAIIVGKIFKIMPC